MFDRVVVLSLAKRVDRRERLRTHLREIEWPFRWPRWVRAIDGSVMPRPAWWMAGSGAWGCMLSHRRALESCINDGISSVLILEDDVYFVDDFAAKVQQFLENVPSDWEQLMIGGQFIARGINGWARDYVAPGVFLVHGVERTHCYAVRGQYLRDLYMKWSESSGHCDHIMGPFQHGRKVYAPQEFLAGQAGGISDITGREKPPERWADQKLICPVRLIRKRETMEAVRGKTHHGGYSLTEGGICKGLDAIVKSKESRERRIERLKTWLTMIEREAISRTPECEPIIFHPDIDETLAFEAVGGGRLVIEDMACCGDVVTNAAQAMGRVVDAFFSDGAILVSKLEASNRIKICRQCEHYLPANSIRGSVCDKCGCFLKIKTRLATEACPVDKWQAQPIDNTARDA